jgi:hypothetical protein
VTGHKGVGCIGGRKSGLGRPSNEHHNPAAWWLHAPEAKSYGERPLAAPCSRWLTVVKQLIAEPVSWLKTSFSDVAQPVFISLH